MEAASDANGKALQARADNLGRRERQQPKKRMAPIKGCFPRVRVVGPIALAGL
jgi:hypothetical protein